MMKKLIRNNWMLSLLINTIILIGILATNGMCYESNDDYAISSRIVAGYPYVGFVNYFLCKFLIAVQQICGSLNAYVIFLLVASFVALVVILRTIFERGSNVIIRAIVVATIAILAYDHYVTVQFTKTAALVMIAGLMLLVESIIMKRRWMYYVGGFVLVYVGAMIRVDALIGAIGFVGIYGISWLIRNRKTLISDGYFTGRRIFVYVLVVVLVAGAVGLDAYSCRINVSTDELSYAEAYSNPRSEIVDYPTYEYYEQNKSSYDELGISENDIYLIDRWYFDYDGAAILDNLNKINSLDRGNDSTLTRVKNAVKKCLKSIISSVRLLNYTGIHILLLCVLGLWMLIILRPKHWLYIVSMAMMTLALYIAIYYMGRPAYRALYVADASAAIWMLYYAMDIKGEEKLNIIQAVCSVMLLVILLGLNLPCSVRGEAKCESAAGKTMTKLQSDYFVDNKDSFYVWATTEKKFGRNYANPLLAPDSSESNITSTGGWGVLSPYLLERMSAYGIKNPIKDLINNDGAYYVGNKRIKRLTEYYNKWYGNQYGEIEMVQVDSVDGMGIWKIVSK